MTGAGCRENSVVIVAPNAGGYASTAAANIGARVIYADVDPVTHLLNVDSLGSSISSEVDAIVVTHLYGNVADVGQIRRTCQRFDIRIIEDCAQAAGADFQGRMVGSLGDVAAFSFYPTKNLAGIGDGGAVSSNNSEIMKSVRILSQYGWTSPYVISESQGMNSRLDEIQATVLRIGLSRLQELNGLRRAIIRKYEIAVEDTTLSMVTSAAENSAAHLAVVLASDSAERENLRERCRSAGIQTSVHYPILDNHQVGLPSPLAEVALPIAENACLRIFTIPCFPDLRDDEVSRICAVLAGSVRQGNNV